MSIFFLPNYSFGTEKTEFRGDHAFKLALNLGELGADGYNLIDGTPVVAENIFCLSEEQPKPEIGFYPKAYCYLNIKSNGENKQLKVSDENQSVILYNYLASYDKKVETPHNLSRCLPSGICIVEVKSIKCFDKVQRNLPDIWQNWKYNYCEVIP